MRPITEAEIKQVDQTIKDLKMDREVAKTVFADVSVSVLFWGRGGKGNKIKQADQTIKDLKMDREVAKTVFADVSGKFTVLLNTC